MSLEEPIQPVSQTLESPQSLFEQIEIKIAKLLRSAQAMHDGLIHTIGSMMSDPQNLDPIEKLINEHLTPLLNDYESLRLDINDETTNLLSLEERTKLNTRLVYAGNLVFGTRDEIQTLLHKINQVIGQSISSADGASS